MSSRCMLFLSLILWLAPSPPVAQAQALVTPSEGIPGLRFELESLEHTTGGTVTLRGELVNDSARAFKVRCEFANPALGCQTWSQPSLVDFDNRTKYDVIYFTGGKQKCACSELPDEIEAGARLKVWAKFPAPPKSVKKISVMFRTFEPLDDVPITD